VDEPISIRALKRFVTERYGPESFTEETLKPIELVRHVLEADRRACSGPEALRAFGDSINIARDEIQTTPDVAIIGSGPAGLAAAHDLALMGHRPVVIEMEPVPAGMLAVGIPEYRLPRDLIRAEVEEIRSLGVEFRCNTEVGKDVSFAELREQYRAVIIAVGAKRSRAIPIPGSEGPGVIGGVEFLRDVALNDRSADSTFSQFGSRVVVIGGGNVAFDVSRTVVRQTGFDVSRSALRQAQVHETHLCCLESIDEMPADDVEILEGHEEGVVLNPSLGPVEVLRNADNKVTGVKFKRCLRAFDDQGKFAPQFDENDTTVIEADTVLWAIGQRPDLSFLGGAEDLPLNERGLLDCDPESLQTSAGDVFLAGDLAHGPRLLIDAVASGKKCARSVHAHLTGRVLQTEQQLVHLNIEGYEREADYEKIARQHIPTVNAEERRSDQRLSVERGYDVYQATTEASRCFDCSVNTVFDSQKCILCGGCADVCPELCLRLVSCDRLTGSGDLAPLLEQRYGHIDLSEMSAIVKDEEKCIRCALCAQRCPVDAITMERFSFGCSLVSAGS